MKIQCSSCGFTGLFVGGGVPPTKCQLCKAGLITRPIQTSLCQQCSFPFPVINTSCPKCKCERITRSKSKENGKRPVPDKVK